MKKQWKPLIIFGGILVVLLLVWLISALVPKMSGTGETTTGTSIADVPAVFEAAETDISRLDVTNATGTFTLVPEEAKDAQGNVSVVWSVKDKEDYPFSSSLVEELAKVAVKVYTSQEITASAADLSSYGLAKPAATMKVTLKSGETHEIKFGNELSSGYYDYVTVDDAGRVCAVASSTCDKVKQGLTDFLDTSLVVGIDSNDLTNMTFERAKDQLKLATDVSLVGEAGSDSAYLDFKITEPIKRSGTSESLTTLATESTGAAVVKFIELDPADLAKYGLDNPQYTFRLKTAEKTVVLKIGSKADDSNYYAMSDQVPAVFTVASSTFTAIDMKVIEMLDRFVSLQSIWNVSKIEADLFGTQFTTEIQMTKDQKADDDGVAFTLDGENARIFSESDKSLYSTFYQRLISVMIAGLDTEAKPTNLHEASMKFYIKADEENKVAAYTKLVEFTKRDEYTYYVFIDGEYTGFYVDGDAAFTSAKDDNEGIIVAYKKMRYAMDHAVDNVFNTEEGYQLN
ncbi:MAG: DUF4340 domain-containing protein [Clostridiaceae bacterium]|nr:DUF4340 domain-containing protein [Clostridiaceae bacterium]